MANECDISKAINDTGTEYVKKYFTLKDHVYETRAVMALVVPKFKSVKFGKRSLNCKGAFLWNIFRNSFTSSNSHVQTDWSIEVPVVVCYVGKTFISLCKFGLVIYLSLICGTTYMYL